MAKHTQIIEFYGLPGCGKTTLCKKMLSSADYRGKRLAISRDISVSYARASIFQKVRSIPWRMVVPLVRLFVKTPFVGFSNLNLYIIFLKKESLYDYVRKYSDIDYFFVDHGLVQSIISLMATSPTELNYAKSQDINLILTKSNVNKVVYCKVSPKTSFLRIRARGGKALGRLDKVENDDVLLQMIQKQAVMFDRMSSIILMNSKDLYSELNLE